MRSYRKKYGPLLIGIKTMVICYLVLFSVSYLTSDTVAYFNDPKQVSNILITAGVWEDEDEEASIEEEKESSLAFTEQDELLFTTCPAEIEVEIENNGAASMQAEGTYEVYFSESGNPEEDGEKIELNEDEGIIAVLASGETGTLTYETEVAGVYQFVMYDHDTAEEDGIWSEPIYVDCEQNEETVADEVTDEEETITEETNEEIDESLPKENEAQETDESEKQENESVDDDNEEVNENHEDDVKDEGDVENDEEASDEVDE